MNFIISSTLITLSFLSQMADAGPLLDRLKEKRQERIDTSSQTNDGNHLEYIKGMGTKFELPEGSILKGNIPYSQNLKNKLDIYSLKNVQNAPVIIVVHGGGWRNGDKTYNKAIENKVKGWVPKGYVVISINYRMLPEANPLEQAQDVSKALQYVQENANTFGGDPSNIVLVGHSAGAHLVSLLSATPESYPNIKLWRGTVSLDSAAYDVNSLMSKRHLKLFDDAFGTDNENWKQSSPLYRLNKSVIPLYLVCSSPRKDSCNQAEQFSNKVNQTGGKAGLYPVNMSHSEINDQLGTQNLYTENINNFISSVLKK